MRLGRFLSLCAVGARHASPCTYPQKKILRAGCGPDMSGPYRNIKDKHLSAVYLPIAAHFSFSQTFSASFKRGLSVS